MKKQSLWILFTITLISCSVFAGGAITLPEPKSTNRGQVYIHGGVGTADLSTPTTYVINRFEIIRAIHKDHFTWTYGGGYKYFFLPMFALGFEINYADNGQTLLVGMGPNPPPGSFITRSYNISFLPTLTLATPLHYLQLLLKLGVARVTQKFYRPDDPAEGPSRTVINQNRFVLITGIGCQANPYIFVSLLYKYISGSNDHNVATAYNFLPDINTPVSYKHIVAVNAFIVNVALTLNL